MRCEIILINPNIATVQTSHGMVHIDLVYLHTYLVYLVYTCVCVSQPYRLRTEWYIHV